MSAHRASTSRPTLRPVIIAVPLVVGLLLACGDGSVEPPPPPDPPRPTTVTVSPATAHLGAFGETVHLAAQVLDQYGQVMASATVSWSSTSAAVATVNTSGLVTAVGNGTATITATAGSASGSAVVTVEQRVSAVTVSAVADTVVERDTLRLFAEATDANGNVVGDALFAWESSNTLVATVDQTGLATGVGAGRSRITATSSGVSGSMVVEVRRAVPASVVVTPDSVNLTALGDTVRLMAEVRDQSGRLMPEEAVTWATEDGTVAAVNADGLVTASGNGTTTVTATAGEVSGRAVVTIVREAWAVVVYPGASVLESGDSLLLSATATDADGHEIEGAVFQWSSDDPSVATVGPMGLVIGTGEGTATITAAVGNAQGTAEITVENPDRDVLVAFYHALDGPNWVDNTNWLSDAPLENWYGVATNDYGRVVELYLSGVWNPSTYREHGLTGSIPAEISRLTHLSYLNLSINDLRGPIPRKLGDLSNLQTLILGVNSLADAIPPELGNLANLSTLRLNYNTLTGGIPPQLGNLANLRTLWLHNNSLTGPIPPQLGNLANLTVLSLSTNSLTGPIPPQLGNLANLTGLWLYGNSLTGPIPPQLGNLANLTQLRLSSNSLTGPIPPTLGDLANLTVLSLFNNSLTGAIPPELGNLANLNTLWLERNSLTGPIPLELGNLANLTWLDLYTNPLTGPLPLSLAELQLLQTFNYYDTDLCVPNDDSFRAWLNAIENHRGTNVDCTEVPVSVNVSPDAATLVSLQDTIRISAEAEDADGNSIPNAQFTWSSNDESVATVDASGLVTAQGNGTAAITASAGGVAGSAEITVEQRVALVNVSPSTHTFTTIGSTVRLSAQAVDGNGHDIPGTQFTWSSDNESVATVDVAGLVTAAGHGTAEVAALAGTHFGTAAITVLDEPSPLVSLVADTAVQTGASIDVKLELAMRDAPHVAGAVAVSISFDSTLIRFDRDRGISATHYRTYISGQGIVRLVVSAPGGLAGSSTLATLSFRAVGQTGSQITLELGIVQVIASQSYADISRELATKGASIRIKP